MTDGRTSTLITPTLYQKPFIIDQLTISKVNQVMKTFISNIYGRNVNVILTASEVLISISAKFNWRQVFTSMSGTDGRRALSKYIAPWKIEDSTHDVCVSPWCWQPRRCDPGRCSRWRRPPWGQTPSLRPVWGQSRLGRCSWRWGNPSSRCQGPQPGTWSIKFWGNREKVLLFVYAKWDV